MKNRALYLLLKNGFNTIDQYANLLGCSKDIAEAIVKEKLEVIPLNLVERSCEIFDCSTDYFLCKVE